MCVEDVIVVLMSIKLSMIKAVSYDIDGIMADSDLQYIATWYETPERNCSAFSVCLSNAVASGLLIAWR